MDNTVDLMSDKGEFFIALSFKELDTNRIAIAIPVNIGNIDDYQERIEKAFKYYGFKSKVPVIEDILKSINTCALDIS